MIKLQYSEVFKRKIRQDDTSDLAIPTWDLISKAIKESRKEGGLEYLEYCRSENKRNNDSLVGFAESVLTHIADTLGEEEMMKFLRQRYLPRTKEFLARTRGIEGALQDLIERQRGHLGELSSIREEADRYVLTYDPCGTGGRLRRTRAVGATKKAHDWSWGKAGVPYYCSHCCLAWEVIPIELQGYPARITIPGDRTEDPCIHLYYKKPELIPEEYFAKVGKKKL